MKLGEIAEKIGLSNITPEIKDAESRDVTKGHVCDLLSDVIANAPTGGVLVTIQVHMNVIAVSVHAGLAAVIFSSGMIPDDSVIKKAIEEEIVLFSAKASSFDLVGRLYSLGLRGSHA